MEISSPNTTNVRNDLFHLFVHPSILVGVKGKPTQKKMPRSISWKVPHSNTDRRVGKSFVSFWGRLSFRRFKMTSLRLFDSSTLSFEAFRRGAASRWSPQRSPPRCPSPRASPRRRPPAEPSPPSSRPERAAPKGAASRGAEGEAPNLGGKKGEKKPLSGLLAPKKRGEKSAPYG